MGLDAVVIILDAEEQFGIDFLDAPDGRIVTAGDFHSEIVIRLAKKGPVDVDVIWRESTKIIGRAVKRDPNTIRPEHRLYQDLGLD